MDYEIGISKYLTLIGHVQSGKTLEEINYCYSSVNHYKTPVIFIVRNIIADQLQLRYRFKDSQLNVKLLNFYKIEQIAEILDNLGIVILLCNEYQLQKIKNVLTIYKGNYNLCIDEVDFSIKSKGCVSVIDQLLAQLKQGASHILGATATPFALFSNEPLLTKIKKIKCNKSYHGIDNLNIKYIETCIHKNFFHDIITINEIYSTLLEKEML